MSATGSISLSGLLGGTAGQIDTTALITQLMTAAAVPQTQLKSQLTTLDSTLSTYQGVNSLVTSMQTAAEALTAPTAFDVTSATSSSSSIAVSSTTSAAPGSTTFSVTQLARAQVTTVAADSAGIVVSDPPSGITIIGADGKSHQISLVSGTAVDVAAAINQAGLGVRASVVTTDQGAVLQLTSYPTGSSNGFTASGFSSTPQNLTTAQDAQISVGDPTAGGYTISSSSNTFSNAITGVTFSVSALVDNASVTVDNDSQTISNNVSALVTAAASALSGIASVTGQGGILQGKSDVRSLSTSILSTVSNGLSGGGSLKTYGIDIDASGAMSFDSAAFAAAYAADPTGTQTAITAFATSLDTVAKAATDATSGSIPATIKALGTQEDGLNDQIDTWTTRLAQIKDNLTTKYTAMETALSKLQSQQTYLTSMFDSINSSSNSGSSSS